MRAISTGNFDGRQFDHVHDALGDVYRLIADALEIGIDFGHRENEAQIRGRRLLRGENVEGKFVDLALGGIDQALVFEDQLAAREIAFGVGLAGAIHRQFRETAHAEQFLPEVLHLLLKARAHLSEPRIYPEIDARHVIFRPFVGRIGEISFQSYRTRSSCPTGKTR